MECSALAGMSLVAPTQASEPISIETASKCFAEAKSLCQTDHGQLWGVSLCGPIMFVDPQIRFIVANQADAKGVLKPDDGAFVGFLPADQNMANTALEWSGVHWTQMLWPLPEQSRERDTLIAHELFHRIQDQLDLPKVKSERECPIGYTRWALLHAIGVESTCNRS